MADERQFGTEGSCRKPRPIQTKILAMPYSAIGKSSTKAVSNRSVAGATIHVSRHDSAVSAGVCSDAGRSRTYPSYPLGGFISDSGIGLPFTSSYLAGGFISDSGIGLPFTSWYLAGSFISDSGIGLSFTSKYFLCELALSCLRFESRTAARHRFRSNCCLEK